MKFREAGVGGATRHFLELFSMPGVKYQALEQPAVSLLRLDPAIREWLEARRAKSSPILGDELLRSLDAPLVHALLRNTIVRDFEFEELLTAARRTILSMVREGNGANVPIELAVSLACQCYFTEFVYATDRSEERYVEQLSSELREWLDGQLDSHFPHTLAIVTCAMYGPLWDLDRNQKLWKRGLDEKLPEALAPLISVHVAEHWEEAAIHSEIPVLEMSEDAVSKAVRQQYEESPYPKWRSVWVNHPRSLLEILRASFPLLDDGPDTNAGTDILVAGCGTGSHPLTEATRYSNARIFAVDLSRASLSYAVRMARRLGIENVEFAQGDIVSFDSIGRDFHMIDVFGVLHHMRDPSAALAILTRRLKPAGLLWLGVYARASRHLIKEVRQSLHLPRDFTQSDIRAARREAIRLLDGSAPATLRDYELFTASEFRDQFLHAHEIDFTLPEIAIAAQKAGLRVIGLSDLQPEAAHAFRECFPDLDSMNDLDKLSAFDREFPDPSCEGLYQILAQKTLPPS